MSFIYNLLSDRITNKKSYISDWLKEKFNNNRPLFYNSVDLRHSGFKVAPVDNNCFPAGFNNLSNAAKIRAESISNTFFEINYPEVKDILIIPENHTRNDKYLENVLTLQEIIANNPNFNVIIGSLIEDIDNKIDIELNCQKKITLHKIVRKNNKIITSSGFEADIIISNNDFTNKPDIILQDLEQNIIPATNIGWYNRKKSQHFTIYKSLAEEFCKIIDIDPWLINAFHEDTSNIDFKDKANIEDLANKTDLILSNIKSKYKEYNIQLDPYCFIKADSGTYGMAIMTVKSADDILLINKKQRNKMNMLKGNIANNNVIIQEGIPTIDNINKSPLEPMIYIMNGVVFGNIFRVNSGRDQNISLNSTGMEFKNLDNLSIKELNIGGNINNILPIYNILGQLSALAASIESSAN
ncbi:glutamate--cysteine ligase [Rickettsiales bacterium]|nr:glutamate--cysteine ligase [Rickettsiales bacterium]